MTTHELQKLIEKLKILCSETQTVEVKSAREGCPTRLYDTLSSFSNQDDGGVILFGIDEKNGFAPVGVYDAHDLQKRVNEQCKEMEPAVRPLFTVLEDLGLVFVSAEIPAIDISERPCFYKGKGRMKGSWIRVGDSDEPMSDYEIYSYEAYRKKYQDDLREVPRVTLPALNQPLLDAYLHALKMEKPNLSSLSNAQIIELISIVRSGKVTLWAVLLLSLFPQAYFPQLSIIACVVPGTQMGSLGSSGERFIDNKRIDGNIPTMLEEAMNFVRANMRRKTVIDGKTGRRTDTPDYPLSAVREVLLNALVHRDYSVHTEGMPIQLTLFSDRMEVRNPGGLYGRLRIDQLGKAQPDTRNPALATALEVMRITENRYSGIPTIRREMQAAGLPEPVFEDDRGSFSVRLYRQPEHPIAKDLLTSLLSFCRTPRTRAELAEFLGMKSVNYAIKTYVMPLVESGHIALSLPMTPSSSKQRFTTVSDRG